MNKTSCFVCSSDATSELQKGVETGKSYHDVECVQCGVFQITDPAKNALNFYKKEERKKISDYIKNNQSEEPVKLNTILLGVITGREN